MARTKRRVAKKILSYPTPIDRTPDLPYTRGQFRRAILVYGRAIGLHDEEGAQDSPKWATVFPSTWRNRWREGMNGAQFYEKKTRRKTKARRDEEARKRRKSRS